MKKKYRRSEINKILGRPLFGFDMHKYGLPYNGAAGVFCDALDPDGIDLMLAAVDVYYPSIHVTSMMHDGTLLNRFEVGASFYTLYTGNSEPEIEFSSEFSLDDFTAEELALQDEMNESLMDLPPTLEEMNALQWSMDRNKRRAVR